MSNPYEYNFHTELEKGHDALGQEQLLELLGDRASVKVSSAEIKALNTTEKELVAAPGADKAILVDEVVAFNDHGGVDYVAGGDFDIRYTNSSGDKAAESLPEAAFVEASADAYHVSKGVQSVAPVANAPVVLHAAASDPTTGDGELDIFVRYRVVDLTKANLS